MLNIMPQSIKHIFKTLVSTECYLTKRNHTLDMDKIEFPSILDEASLELVTQLFGQTVSGCC